MNVNKAPCKDCPRRELGCHATCQIYKDWAEEKKRIREQIKKDKGPFPNFKQPESWSEHHNRRFRKRHTSDD